MENAGVTDRIGWAFGLGLERLGTGLIVFLQSFSIVSRITNSTLKAMRLFDVDDIRVFWSEDEKVTSQFKNFDGNFEAFKFLDPKKNIEPKPFDTAMWITEGFNELDFYDIARSCDPDDIIEKIELIDQFTHPKTGKTSHCYRTFYRGLARGTAFADVEHIDKAIRESLVTRGLTLR